MDKINPSKIKKVSKDYYICLGINKFEKVNGIKYFNVYGLDLFTYNGQFGTTITEGKTGSSLFIGDITSDEFQYRVNNSIGNIEQLEQLINDNIEETGLSPRYKKLGIKE